MPTCLPVTVAIPTKNEEKALPLCLSRLARFSKVVIIDSGSTDATARIGTSEGAEVIQFIWNGRFPKKRNWFLQNHTITTPWVMFLDADELVDEAFCDELASVLPTTQHSGFWVRYHNWFLGKRLRHGEMNQKLALFRPDAGRYQHVPDQHWSTLDMEVHEHPQLKGSIGRLKTPLDHRDERGLEQWLTKHNEYSTWEANRVIAIANSQAESGPEVLPRRQKQKYKLLQKRWFPTAYFLHTYLLKLGFLDGHAGIVYSLLKSHYFWHIQLKVSELQRAASSSSGHV